MATRNLSIRLALENQQQVARGLDQVGTQGQAALKKIESASSPASKGLLALNDASRSAQGEMQALAGRLGPLGSALSALGVGGVAAGAAIAALSVGLKASLVAAAEAEKVELRLGAVLKATGNAAGLTKSQLIDYANALQGSLKINDETLKESIAVLATFRAVSGDTFKTGIKLAADLSAVFGGDLLSSTRQIGLAFQDPAAGMTALRRAGVTFTETQKDLIKSLQESGDLLGAQGVIVEELTRQVGGAAQAEAGGLAGATRGLANEWDDLLEAIGRTEAVMGPALFIVEKISLAIRGLATLSPTIDQQIVNLNKQVLAEDNNIARLTRGGVSGVAIKPHQDRKLALEQELDALIKIARAESDAESAAQDRAKVAAIAARAGIALEASAQELKKEGEKSAKEAAAAAKKAEADRIAGLKEEANWLFRITGLIEKDVEAWEKKNALLPEYIAGLEQDYRLAGLTSEAREEELAVIKAAELAVHGLSEADEARIRSIVRATNAQQAGIEAAKKAAEESTRAWEKFGDDIKRSLTDSIVRGLEDGKPAIKVFFDTLRRAALTAAIKIPVDLVVNAATGLAQGALASASGNIGGDIAGQIATSLGLKVAGASLTSTLFGTAGVGVAAGAQGAALPATAGLLGSGGITGTAGLIASGAGLAVAALGIARATGLIGPNPTVGANAGGFLTESGGRFSIGGIGEDRNKGVSQLAAVQSVLDGALLAINSFVEGSGLLDQQIGDGVREAVQLFASGKDPINVTVESLTKAMIPYVEGLTDAQRATIAATGGLDGLTAVMNEIAAQRALPAELAATRLSLENPKQSQINLLNIETEGLRERARALTDGTQALADIEWIYNFRLGEITAQFATGATDAIGAAVSSIDKEIASLTRQLEDLTFTPQQIEDRNLAELLSDDARAIQRTITATIKATEAEDALAVARGKADTEIAGLQRQLENLTFTPAQIQARDLAELLSDDARAIYKTIVATTAAIEAEEALAVSRKNINTEIAGLQRQLENLTFTPQQIEDRNLAELLSDDARAIYKTIVATTAAIKTENDLITAREKVAAQRATLQDELDNLIMTPAQLVAKARSAIDPLNRALFDSIQIAKDARIAEDRLVTARDNLTQAYERESSALQTTIDKFADFSKSLKAFRDSLLISDLSTLSPEEKYRAAAELFRETSVLAATGDATAIEKMEGVSQAFLDSSRDYNASTAAYATDFQKVQDALTVSADAATAQADVAQRQLTALQTSVSGLITINNSVLLVRDAILAWQAAQTAAQVAQTAASSGAGSSQIIGGSHLKGGAGTYAVDGMSTSLINMLNIASNVTGDLSAVRDYAIANGLTSGDIASRYRDMGYNITQNDILTRAAEQGIPAFASGSNVIPFDMTARIHKGEQIKPAAYVDLDRKEREKTNNLLQQVLTELRADKTQRGAVGTATLERLDAVADKLDATKRELARTG